MEHVNASWKRIVETKKRMSRVIIKGEKNDKKIAFFSVIRNAAIIYIGAQTPKFAQTSKRTTSIINMWTL